MAKTRRDGHIPGYPGVVSVGDSMKLSSVVYDDGIALEGGVEVAVSEGESGAWGALPAITTFCR